MGILRAAATLAAVAATLLGMAAGVATAVARGARAAPIGAAADPASLVGASRQLIVVSAPSHTATTGTLTAYARPAARRSTWRRVLGPWPAELGRAGLSAHRREGDGTTPIGVFAIGRTLYGDAPRPAGLHERYRRLGCGDWWDEDPASPRYNRLVTVPCGVTPGFAGGSEALWTETVAYPFLAVIEFNADPTRRGAGAPGSGIFLHSWVGGPTNGCVALHRPELLTLLRWLRPAAAPVIDLGAVVRAEGVPAQTIAGPLG